MQSILSFLADHRNRNVTAPGGLGGQCVDLTNLWLVANGGRPVRANAVDWAHTAIPGWRWEQNARSNAPSGGAVVVWRANAPAVGIGPYGHVAVAVAADAMYLLSVDQDWPPGAPVALVLHNYNGVAGWWSLS